MSDFLELLTDALVTAGDKWSMDVEDDGSLTCPCGENMVEDDAMYHWSRHTAVDVIATIGFTKKEDN